MATSNIEKALTVLRGIGDRNADLAIKYVHPKRYTEHNPSAADGIDGLKAYIESIPHDNHHLKVVRKFEDGAYVFTQSDGEILGQNTFFDVFKFEEGFIVEHWVYAAKSAPPNKSGHTQLDGPTEANDNEDTEQNKAFMEHYFETFHIAGDHSNLSQYFSGDICVRHEPGVSDGVTAFLRDVEATKNRRTIDKLNFLLGEKDFVFITANGTFDGDVVTYVDLYRVADRKNVEHWGFIEKVPPKDQWKNDNGIF